MPSVSPNYKFCTRSGLAQDEKRATWPLNGTAQRLTEAGKQREKGVKVAKVKFLGAEKGPERGLRKG